MTTGVEIRPGVGERQEVEAVVDDVELRCPLEDLRDVQALGNLRVDARRPPTSLEEPRCSRRADVSESPVAKSVTSCPRETSPSVKSEAKSSHGP